MILAETALSFLGIGLQPPIISWACCFRKHRIFVRLRRRRGCYYACGGNRHRRLSLNFLGDGLRDAADPYESV